LTNIPKQKSSLHVQRNFEYSALFILSNKLSYTQLYR